MVSFSNDKSTKRKNSLIIISTVIVVSLDPDPEKNLTTEHTKTFFVVPKIKVQIKNIHFFKQFKYYNCFSTKLLSSYNS